MSGATLLENASRTSTEVRELVVKLEGISDSLTGVPRASEAWAIVPSRCLSAILRRVWLRYKEQCPWRLAASVRVRSSDGAVGSSAG